MTQRSEEQGKLLYDILLDLDNVANEASYWLRETDIELSSALYNALFAESIPPSNGVVSDETFTMLQAFFDNFESRSKKKLGWWRKLNMKYVTRRFEVLRDACSQFHLAT